MTTFLKVAFVAIAHCVAGVLLYRGRVFSHVEILQSDLLVFFLPGFLALIAYGAVYWTSGILQAKPILRIVIAIPFSLFAVCFSSWLFAVIAFNQYGT